MIWGLSIVLENSWQAPYRKMRVDLIKKSCHNHWPIFFLVLVMISLYQESRIKLSGSWSTSPLYICGNCLVGRVSELGLQDLVQLWQPDRNHPLPSHCFLCSPELLMTTSCGATPLIVFFAWPPGSSVLSGLRGFYILPLPGFLCLKDLHLPECCQLSRSFPGVSSFALWQLSSHVSNLEAPWN